ncbi:hypothetical protein J437_LFUL002335 [Ladona fulva]|uniref:Uncharacterized protein n=1 Tax=Ladona fulva TaxID=123851 RepID=A0A8K0NYZ1_LADFU|nr:hypothetical protein J437_LFUL002335 [Ladona fulva]
MLQKEQKMLKDEITYLKVTCKFLEGNNVSILKKCNELQLKLQENITAQEKRLDSILQERQNLMLKTQKLKYKIKQLQETNSRLCEEVESYKKSSNGKCDAAVQVPSENSKSKKEGKSAKESFAESLKSNAISNAQHNISKIIETNSSTMDEEMILTDLFFGRNSDYFISNARETILNYI